MPRSATSTSNNPNRLDGKARPFSSEVQRCPTGPPITEDDLKAFVLGAYIEQAHTLAVGANDPVLECIADAVASVRAAVSTGNVLDADPTKVPNSLKGLTVRHAGYALLQRIGVSLSADQVDSRKEDRSRLNRISDAKVEVEEAGHARARLGRDADRPECGCHPSSPPANQPGKDARLMIFADPIPFDEAIENRVAKRLLPTDLDTEQL